MNARNFVFHYSTNTIILSRAFSEFVTGRLKRLFSFPFFTSLLTLLPLRIGLNGSLQANWIIICEYNPDELTTTADPQLHRKSCAFASLSKMNVTLDRYLDVRRNSLLQTSLASINTVVWATVNVIRTWAAVAAPRGKPTASGVRFVSQRNRVPFDLMD